MKKRSQPTVPGPVGEAVEKAREVADGVEKHGATISLKAATAPEIRAVADGLVQAETAFRASLVKFSGHLKPQLKISNAAAAKFIGDAKKPISCVLGNHWNEGWEQVGFLQNHLRCPKKIIERIALLERMAIFLGAHPECEAVAQNITAARAQELHQALSSANRAIGLADTEHKEIRLTRDQEKKALRKLVADVIVEVRRKLPADSSLWSSFGLTAPKPRARRPAKIEARATTPAQSADGTTRTAAAPASTVPAPAPAKPVGLMS